MKYFSSSNKKEERTLAVISMLISLMMPLFYFIFPRKMVLPMSVLALSIIVIITVTIFIIAKRKKTLPKNYWLIVVGFAVAGLLIYFSVTRYQHQRIERKKNLYIKERFGLSNETGLNTK